MAAVISTTARVTLVAVAAAVAAAAAVVAVHLKRSSPLRPKPANPPSEPRPPAKSSITQLVRPYHTDSRGIAFGGQILAWIDTVAGVTAKRHCHSPCVTASVDSVHFLAPVKLGDMCNLKATVNRSWRTSMEIGVKVEAEDMRTGERRYCCHAYLTFVAVQDGVPITVPPVFPQSPDEHRRFDEADERRSARVLRKARLEHEIVPILPIIGVAPNAFAAQLHPPSTSPSSHIHPTTPNHTRITCADTYTETVEIVFPEHANSLGITFGGQIMMWMEYCAAMAAMRLTHTPILTASMDSIAFRRPTRVGDVVTIRAIVSAAFDRSVEVYVTVETEDLAGTHNVTNDAWLTFVAVDNHGSLVSVPVIDAVSTDAVKRREGAAQRKSRRLRERDLAHTAVSTWPSVAVDSVTSPISP